MARAKRKSDELYNARRRAKRLIARLEKQAPENESARRAQESYIAALREQIQQTYVAKRSASEITRAGESAVKLNRQTSIPRANRTRAKRADAIFRQQLARGRMGEPSAFTPAEVSVFYAATRRIWRGRDVRNRNDLIKEALGVSTLAEAFDKVMAGNADAVKAYDDFNDGTNDGERMRSATWDSFVTLVG